MPERDPVRFGKYLLFERIAVGGMAEVFRAKPQGEDEQELALKRIHPHHLENDDFVSMLIDEAKISFQLDHPNIVHVVDMGRVDKHYFIAMEFIAGRDLRRCMERLAESGRAFPIPDAVAVIARVARGLDYAHSKSDGRGKKMEIVHRDISPQNVLVGFDGNVKVIDFGIAKAAGRLMETQVGILKGKYAYMSPEQATGGALDHRTDIFSAGIMLYECVVGRHPFRAPHDLETLRNIKNCTMVPAREANPQIPASVDAVIKKALSPRKEDRYFTAGAMAVELEKALSKIAPRYAEQEIADFIGGLFSDEIVNGGAIREYIAPTEVKASQPKPKNLAGRAETLAPSEQRTIGAADPRRGGPGAKPLETVMREVNTSSRTMPAPSLGATAVAEGVSGTMAMPARGAPIVIGPSKGEQFKEAMASFFQRIQDGALTTTDSVVLMGFSTVVVILALVLLMWEPITPQPQIPVKGAPKGKPAAARTAPGKTAATPMGTPRVVIAEQSIGWVNVTSLPPGADIRVDGRLVGKTPKKLELPAGQVAIEVIDDETGVAQERKVIVKPGEEARAAFQL